MRLHGGLQALCGRHAHASTDPTALEESALSTWRLVLAWPRFVGSEARCRGGQPLVLALLCL